jgi:hypothetical protein
MACACKVSRYVNKVEEHYGTSILPAKKTNISEKISVFFKKLIIVLICLPFIPIMILTLLVRNWFTKNPIQLDKFINFKKSNLKNVRKQ